MCQGVNQVSFGYIKGSVTRRSTSTRNGAVYHRPEATRRPIGRTVRRCLSSCVNTASHWPMRTHLTFPWRRAWKSVRSIGIMTPVTTRVIILQLQINSRRVLITAVEIVFRRQQNFVKAWAYCVRWKVRYVRHCVGRVGVVGADETRAENIRPKQIRSIEFLAQLAAHSIQLAVHGGVSAVKPYVSIILDSLSLVNKK